MQNTQYRRHISVCIFTRCQLEYWVSIIGIRNERKIMQVKTQQLYYVVEIR
jgi:hypothetical protein